MFTVKVIQRRLKPLLHALLSLPLVWLVVQWGYAFAGQPHDLGFNPHETSNRMTGEWAMRILLLSLAISPVIKLTGSQKWLMLRRMLGLWSFVYVLAHLVSYIALDMVFDWHELWLDLIKRTYITVGMLAVLLMLPLALTSTNSAIRRLGAKAWRRLHQLVYAVGPLVIVHFIMMRKGWQVEPLVYGAVLMGLLAFRLPALKRFWQKRRSQFRRQLPAA